MVFLGGAVLADIMKAREEWYEQGLECVLAELGRAE